MAILKIMFNATTRLIIHLFAGAILTIIAAWVCAYYIDITDSNLDSKSAYTSESVPCWDVNIVRGYGVQWVHASLRITQSSILKWEEVNNTFAPSWSRLRGAVADVNGPIVLIDDARGLPCVSMYSSIDGKYTTPSQYNMKKSNGIPLKPYVNRDGHVHPRSLPTKLIASGFMFDTIFFALLSLGVFKIQKLTRNILRKLRGYCTVCGYDLQYEYATGCPECGWNRNNLNVIESESK